MNKIAIFVIGLGIIITLIGLLMLKTPLVKFTNLYTNVSWTPYIESFERE